ncbi:pentatricopeptide repeat-containing protein At1g19720 [Prosopis cineraria]|uniref:pentatricopeptide repeat-containing protein At1g19720 n=1 Tax=Prosopis cineraria TaxID=364024 RepID=UPI0024102F34|nr:pentatricopeptide repeat-containing protein At1g19720 [Prosopis cineraria]
MEKNLIILSKSKPPSLTPSYSVNGTQLEFHHKNIKPISKLSFSKNAKPIDARLDKLCVEGPLSEAVKVLDSLAQQGSSVRPKTYINLLQSCIDHECIGMGRELHARIGLVEEVNSFVETKLVSMYAKCGYLEEARKVFDEMREKNLYTWSAMIGACSRGRSWKEVLELFYRMMEDGFLPDRLLIPKIMQACGKCGDFETGKLIHSLAIRCGMTNSMRVNNSILTVYAKSGDMNGAEKFFTNMDERDMVSWNAIISGYCQKGEIEQARAYFDAMHEKGIEPGLVIWNVLIASYNELGRCDAAIELMREMENIGITPDVYTWTSMISGFTQNGRLNQAFDLLKRMFLAGIKPTDITIASAISACVTLKSLNMGLEIHSMAVKMSLVDNLPVANSLIDMYSKCGNLEAAQRVFDMMLERDVYSWNTIIGGYYQAGYCSKAHELFMRMQESDVSPNVVTWNIMITGYIQNGDEDRALDLFQRIEKEGNIKRNTASWNSLISGYLQSGQKDKALWIFRQMQISHVIPNSVTILSVLHACANLVSGKKVKEVHCCALRRNLTSETSVSNSLIATYTKSGYITYSRAIFYGMTSKDIISWNSLIAGYVLHGQSESALQLVYQMQKEGLQPSRGTFASIILAYSLAGMVNEGKSVFSSITEEYQIRPGLEHYAAVVHLLGRSGMLAEAMEFIRNMPIEPNTSVWAAMLTACRFHKNFGLATLAGEHLLTLEPGNNVIRHLLSQSYSLCGKIWEAPRVTKLEKPVGQCWIETKNIVHTFVTGYGSEPLSEKLHSWVERVALKIKKPISENGVWIEEEEEGIGVVHSEKLAFAFSLIDSHHHANKVIRIVKNLRMCRDCHRTAKYISLAYGCEIYANDSSCFHHFKGGLCSCKDYW